MNAQTEQLIYWKQQYDLIRQERDDITKLCAEQEQRLEKAVEALRKISALIDAEPDPIEMGNKALFLSRSVLEEISEKEPTDA